MVRFEKQGKLLPRYIRPFEILEKVGTVAYRLTLPPSLSGAHVMFHVSMKMNHLNGRDIKALFIFGLLTIYCFRIEKGI